MGKPAMGINLLTVVTVIAIFFSMIYYWATTKNKYMRLAYYVAILNGLLSIATNILLGSKPEQEAMYLYNFSAAWIVLMGIQGLLRLGREKH